MSRQKPSSSMTAEQLVLAIEELSEIVVLFDAEDRVVIANRAWRDLNRDITEFTKPGTRFEDHLQALVKQGLVPEAEGRENEWVRERMERHLNPSGPFEVLRQDGQWIRVHEQRLPNGGTILIISDITASKRFEEELTKTRGELEMRVEELRNSEALFRAVVDNSPTKIHIKDVEGRYLLINKEAEKLFGITDEEGRGKTTYDLFEKDVADAFTAHDRMIIESGEATEDEEEFTTEDGVLTYLTTKFPILDQGEVTAIGAIGTNITKRKRTERARMEEESRFRAVFDGSAAAISLKGMDGRFLLVNKTYAEWHDTEPSKIIGRRLSDFFPKENVDELQAADLQVLETGEELVSEMTRTFQDGVTRTLINYKRPILSAAGKVVSVATILTDITERKLMEENLRKAHDDLEIRVAERTRELSQEVSERTRVEQFLRDALESIADGAILYDANDRVVMWNSNYEKSFTGISDVLVPGARFEDINRVIAERGLVKGAQEDVDAWVRQRVRMHHQYDGPFEMEMADGRWALISEYKPQDGGTFIVRTDITERKQAERTLIEAKKDAETANRAKSEFLANMSHELRTPLNAIIGFSDLIRNKVLGAENFDKYFTYADDINHSGIHLLDIINDILDLSAIEAEKLELNPELVGLATMVTVAEQFLRQKADDEGVQIINTVGMDTPVIRADKLRVKQILINILSNAVKFTPRGGSVTISADLDADGCMAIAVADTGIGMDEAEIAKALEPFGQADSTLSRKYEGTGLGLPLSKRLAESHGGTLEVESSPGEGTTVTVRFPAERVIVGSEIEEGPSKSKSAEKRLH